MVWAFTLLVGLSLSSQTAGANPFPEYDNIRPNIDFWTKVYTQYTTRQAIVHDANHLNIIYDVIDLKPHDTARARKINRRRTKHAKARYQKILETLAARPNTKNKTARRIAALFGPQASKGTYRRAATQVRCQIGQCNRFRAGLIRSGAYLDQIKEIFKANGLPVRLSYLPHVESSFNYQAYSKFGAAGIWQFTRSTGKRFMNVGYVLDERRDPISATHAAAALLKENYERLGSWPLAITAYNHGAAGMHRAKRKHGTYPVIFDTYRSRTFKFASRNFYSEFIAASKVASQYQKYFGDLSLDRPFPIRTVTLKSYIGFDDLREHFNLPVDLAKSLNPALRPPVFNGQKYIPKGYRFRLPENMHPAASKRASIPATLYKSRQKPSQFYTVQRGDTAGRIARAHGVKLSELILSNNLSRRATIFPRQTLRIPLPGEGLQKPPKPPPHKTETVVAAKAVRSKPRSPIADATNAVRDYPEPVWASIIPTPSLDPGSSATGKHRASNIADLPSEEIVAVDIRFKHIQGHASPPTGTLFVEVEETLGHFAEWAGVRTQRIRRLNGLPFGKRLHLHQKVAIPLDKVASQAFEEKRYEYHKRLQEDFFSVYRIGEMRTYRVRVGDNLWALSLDKFDIPMWLLKNCNPEVDFTDLRMHQTLMIPVIEKTENGASQAGPMPAPDESNRPWHHHSLL
jgi:membrane-bound lytic murein transglycosylase D